MKKHNRFNKPDTFGEIIDRQAHNEWDHPLPTLKEILKERNVPRTDIDALMDSLEKSFCKFRIMKDKEYLEYIGFHGQLVSLKTSKLISSKEYEAQSKQLFDKYDKEENYNMDINSSNIIKFVAIGIALGFRAEMLAELTHKSLKQIKRIINASNFNPSWIISPPQSVIAKPDFKKENEIAWLEARASLSPIKLRIWDTFSKDFNDKRTLIGQRFNNDIRQYSYWISSITAKKLGVRDLPPEYIPLFS